MPSPRMPPSPREAPSTVHVVSLPLRLRLRAVRPPGPRFQEISDARRGLDGDPRQAGPLHRRIGLEPHLHVLTPAVGVADEGRRAGS